MKLISILMLFVMLGCATSTSNDELQKWKLEIMEAETNFNDLAQKEGIVKAFSVYAANDAVIKRGGKLVMGNKAITDWYENDSRPNETLTWKPDFIDVSNSGDLGYTYGGFVFTSIDSTGVSRQNTGTFHTVWKRQTDGSWKFVWD